MSGPGMKDSLAIGPLNALVDESTEPVKGWGLLKKECVPACHLLGLCYRHFKGAAVARK
jgi:hypothetical protein